MTTLDVLAGVALALVLWGFYWYRWVCRARRAVEPGYPYVRVDQDGGARELSPEERAYLSDEFAPTDGGRPYVKSHYGQLDGWRSRAGFLLRRRLPRGIEIRPVHPDFDARMAEREDDELELNRAVGDSIERRPDGSILCTPNPALGRRERFERMRAAYLAEQLELELMARVQPGSSA